MIRFPLFAATGVLCFLSGCTPQTQSSSQLSAPAQAAALESKTQTHAGLNSTLWVQTAVEAHVSALQSYKLAALQLDEALKNKTWTASIEQSARPAREYSRLPPAIVLDIDETVLDNSPLQARLVKKGLDYDGLAWGEWVYEANAKAIPGAVEFLKMARAKNIKIFFISNRARGEEAATQKNLNRVGLLPKMGDDMVLSRFEKVGWTNDKASRRRYLSGKYRILMLVGDDFNDFVTGAKTSLSTRRKLMTQHQKMWGQKWIVIANPLYGSWEGAVLDFDYEKSDDEKLKRKLSVLDSREIPK